MVFFELGLSLPSLGFEVQFFKCVLDESGQTIHFSTQPLGHGPFPSPLPTVAKINVNEYPLPFFLAGSLMFKILARFEYTDELYLVFFFPPE